MGSRIDSVLTQTRTPSVDWAPKPAGPSSSNSAPPPASKPQQQAMPRYHMSVKYMDACIRALIYTHANKHRYISTAGTRRPGRGCQTSRRIRRWPPTEMMTSPTLLPTIPCTEYVNPCRFLELQLFQFVRRHISLWDFHGDDCMPNALPSGEVTGQYRPLESTQAPCDMLLRSGSGN